MGNQPAVARESRRKSLPTVLLAVVIAASAAGGVTAALLAQSPAGQKLAVPQWQIDAGGKMEFDVASVKQDTAAPGPQTVHSNIPLGPQDLYAPTGGLLSAANFPLIQYMIFAYKLTPNQTRDAVSKLPKWATSDRYDIQARADGNPTKDQFRLMMQALLSDRFKLAVHFETQQLPVFALVLDKPGKLGSQIQPHPPELPCSTAPPPPGTPGPLPTVAGGFPEICGALTGVKASAPGRVRAGARNMAMPMLVTSLSAIGVDRPVLDKTGLTGSYDFVIEWTPEINGPLPPGATFQPDPSGPTLLQALKEQLGFKLDSQTGPVDVIVIDHVEQPSEN
jgi:uncharacterized protein (TIGR03435 family)